MKGEHIFLIILEVIVSAVLFIVSLLFKSIIVFLFAVSILPVMLSNFFRSIFQATGEFNKYSKIVYKYTIFYMILNIILALIFKSKNYMLYCLTTFWANLLSIFVIEIKFLYKYRKIQAYISKEDITNSVKVGFFILLGNLVVIGLFGIDKWFVKLFLDTNDFAYYSFAVSMLNIINTLVNAISITFYNYLFENNSKNKINKLKKFLIALGGFASLAYFPLAIIVNTFIKKYIPSLNIIAVTFASFPYMILINALYVNLYKANKNERKYLKVVIGILLISIFYNTIALLIFHNTFAIAIATIFTLLTWVIYSTKDLKNVTESKSMYIYMFTLTISFLILTHINNTVLGGCIYIVIYFLLTYIINKDVLIQIKNESSKFLKRKIRELE